MNLFTTTLNAVFPLNTDAQDIDILFQYLEYLEKNKLVAGLGNWAEFLRSKQS